MNHDKGGGYPRLTMATKTLQARYPIVVLGAMGVSRMTED
jgi:hypothetical protein